MDDEPPQPLINPNPAASRQTIASARSALRLRLGSSNSSNPASAMPDDSRNHCGLVTAALATQPVPPVVVTVSVDVAVPLAASVMLVGDTTHVGGTPVAGVTAQVSATGPAKPLPDVPVMTDVLVVVAFNAGTAAVSVVGLAANVKLPELAAFTTSESAVAAEVAKVASPE
jgi:hypothetical protein